MKKSSIKYVFVLSVFLNSLYSSELSFQKDIKPILDNRCVVCHSCYNSPCQFKLSSFDSLQRGATKEEIYKNRITPAKPSRMFIDANSQQQWRELGFYSVIKNIHGNSIMIELLQQKQKKPLNIGEYSPETDELTCSKDMKELSEYLKKNPYHGMPYGFPALKKDESEKLISWLKSDIKDDISFDQEIPKELQDFEIFLNDKRLKYQVTARYIYEHLFLAHIKFKSSDSFYRLIRINLKTGVPIKTRVPYGQAQAPFYYKFEKITSTIVHKTHMVYKIDTQKLRRYKELFIDTQWNENPHMPSYDTKIASNPLESFKQIPLQSRYLFMLDNIDFFIRTFIRGPVCKGQIALNVINDHFWVIFKEPKFDYTIQDSDFINQNLQNLALPTEYGSDAEILNVIDIYKYNNDTIKYYENKNSLYAHYKNILGFNTIWKGNSSGSKDNDAVLTIYRHFDSASVHKGALGDIPKTMWMIDYPLLERLYYSLVAGFDVYGNTQHKVLVRKYMDRLRIEGESNFLEYLPISKRKTIFESWYKGELSKNLVTYTPSKNEATLKTDYKSFVRNILDYTNTPIDTINFKEDSYTKDQSSNSFKTKEDIEQALKGIALDGEINRFKKFSSDNFNLIYIRFKFKNKKDLVYTMVINRWHDNVAFMFNEDLRLDVKKDKVNFLEGFIGSYPNYFVVVKEDEIQEFFSLLKEAVDESKLLKFFINRNNKNFWEEYDWFQKRFYEDQPIEAGLFDLNRYYQKVIE